jgi:hypothetical protein
VIALFHLDNAVNRAANVPVVVAPLAVCDGFTAHSPGILGGLLSREPCITTRPTRRHLIPGQPGMRSAARISRINQRKRGGQNIRARGRNITCNPYPLLGRVGSGRVGSL